MRNDPVPLEAPPSDELVVYLRFNPRDAERIRRLADRVKTADLRSDVSTFEAAADGAEHAVPVRVVARSIDEVRVIAALFVRLGCTEPTIESGQT